PIPGCSQTTLDFVGGLPWLSFHLNKVAFGAANCGVSGVYTALAGGTQKQRIANLATPANYRNSSIFSAPALYDSRVVYTAGNVFGSTALFLGPVSTTGDPDKILANLETPYPDSSGRKIGAFGTSRLWNQSVVFAAQRDDGLNGILSTNLSGAAPRLIANTNTVVPAYGGTFTQFPGYTVSGTIPGGSRIVLHGTSSSIPVAGNGLFQSRKGKLRKVVADGDAIASSQVCRIDTLSAQALSRAKLVFATAPFGGCAPGGIFTADLN
ncbi:MAG: hypothetical protein WCD18_24295, partial [Thermosynechococcaceae cyanobacterium]